MKEAFDKFLETGSAEDTGEEGMDLDSVGSMFDEGATDPLMDALSSAGFEVDDEKAQRIRAILEETPEDMEGEEHESAETPGMEKAEHAGVSPRGMM
jgi:hypothetical protein